MSGDPVAAEGDRSNEIPMSADEAPLEFLYFPKLPTELRMKIWGFAARTRNTIELKVERYPIYHRERPRRETGKRTRSAYFTWGYQISSPSPPRGVLFSCKESRFKSLKSGPRYLRLKNKTAKIYFFPSIDTISMDSSSHFALVQLGPNVGLGKTQATGFSDIQSIFLPEGFASTGSVWMQLPNYLGSIKEMTVGFYEPTSSTSADMKLGLADCLDKQLQVIHHRSRHGRPAKALKQRMDWAVYRFLAVTPSPAPPSRRGPIFPPSHSHPVVNITSNIATQEAGATLRCPYDPLCRGLIPNFISNAQNLDRSASRS